MGLDIVELTMDIEHQFGVDITADDMTALIEAGATTKHPDIVLRDLLELIRQRLAARTRPRDLAECRQMCIDAIKHVAPHVEEAALLKEPLSSLLADEERSQVWKEFAGYSRMPPPLLASQFRWFRAALHSIPEDLDSLDALSEQIWQDCLVERDITPDEADRSLIWARLRALVAAVVFVDLDKVTLDSRLIADLGVD